MRSDNVGVVKRFQRATTHRAALTSQQRPRRDGQRFDLRDRTAAANQLLLCAIVAVLFVVGLVGGFIHRPELFALGALLIGLGGIAALAVPCRGRAFPPAGSPCCRSSTSSRSR